MTKKIAYLLIIASTLLIAYNIFEQEPWRNSISSVLIIIAMIGIIWIQRKQNS